MIKAQNSQFTNPSADLRITSMLNAQVIQVMLGCASHGNTLFPLISCPIHLNQLQMPNRASLFTDEHQSLENNNAKMEFF